jgi:zinc protease
MSALFLSLALAAAPAPFIEGPSVEGIDSYRLPNGLTVLLINDPAKPSTTVNLTVFVGSRHENSGERGMAHLFEHMLFKETKRFKDVKKELGDLGGEANGTTWYDRTNYYESFPATPANLKRALEVEADRLVNAIISREKLATEMSVVRNEFEMGENSPQSVLSDRTVAAAYTWHAYGNTTIGAKSDIELVPQERLVAFYKSYYQPDNAVLMVAGRFDPTSTLKMIAATLGAIPKPKRVLPLTYTVEPTQDGERTVTVRRVGGTPVITTVYHTPSGTDPDAAAVDVIERLLGETPSGRLYREVVEPGKAAKAGCYAFQLKEPGYFSCYAELKEKDAVAPAREGLLAQVEGLASKPLKPEELRRAKSALAKQFELMLNDSERVGIVLSEFAALGDWRMLFIHRDRIAQVTEADVLRVAKKYLVPSNRTLGEYVPTEGPVRAEIPALVDLRPVLDAYVPKAGLSKGEAFDPNVANLDSRTQKSALLNGMKVAVLPKKTRGGSVAIALQLKFGSLSSLSNQRAVADFTARLLTRGTTKRSRQAFKDALDELNATLGFRTEPQGLVATMEVRRQQLAPALELMVEALRMPAFAEVELAQAKNEVVADVEQKKSDPMALGMSGLQRNLAGYPTAHPFGVPTFDEVLVQTKTVTVAQLKAFHQSHYGAQSGFVAVVGDVDVAEVQQALGAALGGWVAPQKYERIPDPYRAPEAAEVVTRTPDKAMAFFGAGTLVKLTEADPAYPALLMADYLLGGGFMNGRVPQRLREKEGLSYGAGTVLHVDAVDDSAGFLGYAISNPANAPKVEVGFKEEVSKAVAQGFTQAEVDAAKQGLLQAREQQRAQDESVAGMLLGHLEHGRAFAWEGALDGKLQGLSAAQVSEALKRFIDPSKFIYVKAGDFKTVAAPK